MKKKTVLAVYDTYTDVQDALEALTKNGIDKQHISVVGKGNEKVMNDFEYNKENKDILFWGELGTFWGGLFGFLVGGLFFFVPGFGPLIATGPLTAALAGTVGGAMLGGAITALSAALIDWGLSEEEAIKYENYVKDNKFLLIVHGDDSQTEKAKELLDQLGKGSVTLHQ